MLYLTGIFIYLYNLFNTYFWKEHTIIVFTNMGVRWLLGIY